MVADCAWISKESPAMSLDSVCSSVSVESVSVAWQQHWDSAEYLRTMTTAVYTEERKEGGRRSQGYREEEG